MIKKIIIIAIMSLMLFQAPAFAIETQGEVIFRDSLYGAAIGAILGGAFYLLDDKDLDKKLASGVIIGTFGGLIYGVYENMSLAEIENGKIKYAIPTPVIEKEDDAYRVSASLFKARF